MPTKPVKIDIPVAKLNTETFKTLPRLRLDSSNLLYLKVYKELIERIRLNGIEVIKMKELIKPSSKKPKSRKTVTIMVRSLWKLSISPINLEVRQLGFSKEVPSRSLVVVVTGQAIGKVSMVPEYLNNVLPEFLGVNNIATTGDIGVFISNKDEHVQYLDVFLNTSLGQTILELSKYGTTNQHIDLQIFMRQYVPLIFVNKVTRLVESAIEEYEAKAWRAYFKAMKIVEEYLKPTLVKTTGTSRLIIAKNAGRLDGAGLLAFGLLEEITKHFGKSIKLYNVLEIKSGNVPRLKDYKGVSGIPYITIDSIDDSGIIDEEKMAFIPKEKYKRSFTKTKNHDILLVKDGIGSLGKVAVALGEYPVMSGIFILRGKAIEDELLYYIVTILKTRFYKKIMEMISYGTTGQISLTKRDVENLLMPILDNYKKIGALFKEFVENMYKANALKRQAIAELENYILELVG